MVTLADHPERPPHTPIAIPLRTGDHTGVGSHPDHRRLDQLPALAGGGDEAPLRRQAFRPVRRRAAV